MTGPNPDAELDEALGVDQLPPAAVTDDHLARATGLLSGPPGYREPELVERVAQAIADAEQRGAARVIAEHAAAGTG